MKERPLIFSPWSVRRILEDNKSETRRVIDEQICFGSAGPNEPLKLRGLTPLKCPLGKVGDRIWVREPWYPAFKQTDTESGCIFKADYGFRKDLVRDYTPHGGWKSPLFLPRTFARIVLELIDIQVERLQDITEQAAIAEGIHEFNLSNGLVYGYDPNGTPGGMVMDTARLAYAALWDSLHIKDGHTWSTNPFVWVYKFRRLLP